MNTQSRAKPFEYLRLTSLGVIGALVKNDDPEVVKSLLGTEIIPLCLRIMETGNELSRTVAIFIVQKIIADPAGLEYICQTTERFFAVVSVLNNLVDQMVVSASSVNAASGASSAAAASNANAGENKSARVLKHVVRCYLRLTDDRKAAETLKPLLPKPLQTGEGHRKLLELCGDDPATAKFLSELMTRLYEESGQK